MPTLEWIGKDKVINHHQDVPFRILDKKYTFNAENSENMIIHGDNLLALKSLLPQYEGRVDCVYIDPPYNTGNEKWIYNDNVNDPKIKKWLGEVVGAEGEDLSRHDKWLCMMYPRLKLLHKLLSTNGVIFISIDDTELSHLKLVCDEIFGASNFIGYITWLKKRKGSFLSKRLVSLTEYVVAYAKNIKNVELFGGKAEEGESQPIVKRTNKVSTLSFRALSVKTKLKDGIYKKGVYGEKLNPVTLECDIEIKNGIITNEFSLTAPFVWSQQFLETELLKGTQIVINTNNFQPRVFRKTDELSHKGFSSIINGVQITATNEDAYEELKKIFEDIKLFDYSKPKELISLLVESVTHFNKNAIILDSFAGSGTTGHAVLNLNKKDGGNRKFILVEMMDYADTITAERVKRVINGYGKGEKFVDGLPGNFSFYELGQPLFKEDKNLNEEVSEEEIRKYIYFMETKKSINTNQNDNQYLLGENNDTAYYFYYKKNEITVLNHDFLSTINTKASQYVIYADKCSLSIETMSKYNIVFKKIPRDIARF